MKKSIAVLAIVLTTAVFSNKCIGQTIPDAAENEHFRLEYNGYTSYCNIGYIVGIQNYTAEPLYIVITWAVGAQLVQIPPYSYEVFWLPGEYVMNSRIKARAFSMTTNIPSLTVRVTGNYYF